MTAELVDYRLAHYAKTRIEKAAELSAGPGLHEARQLQRLLSKFDALGLGNDMLAIFEKKT